MRCMGRLIWRQWNRGEVYEKYGTLIFMIFMIGTDLECLPKWGNSIKDK